MKFLKRGRLFTGLLGATTVAVLTLATPHALADTKSYKSTQTGTHTVQGAILDTYRSLGGPTSRLGYPRTDELPTPFTVGRYNLFENGAIYWSPKTGAHAVKGAIWTTYGALGWETSFLGFPTTNELKTPKKAGGYNTFQHGSIYWSSKTGAHSIAGAIRDRWASMGWENSKLGFPKTNEFPIPGGRAQDFQCGSIQWSAKGGTKVVGCGTTSTAPKPTPKPTPKPAPQPATKPVPVGGYANCTAVRNAGAAPLYRGEPGYAPKLDRDGDGIACE